MVSVGRTPGFELGAWHRQAPCQSLVLRGMPPHANAPAAARAAPHAAGDAVRGSPPQHAPIPPCPAAATPPCSRRADRQAGRQVGRQAGRQAFNDNKNDSQPAQTGRQALNRQPASQTGRRTAGQPASRQPASQPARQTDRQTDRHTIDSA
jgi:hypothetical protein